MIDRTELMHWPVELPKLAAVMASWDYRTMHVTEACRSGQLKIPVQIAILGVDDDELLHLGVFRRLADLRFRQVHGQSIGKAIEAQRLIKVKQLLSSTNWPIQRIASASGYTNTNRLSHLFTQRFGVFMREWRRKASPFL